MLSTKRLSAALLLIAAMLLATACGDERSTLDKARDQGYIVAGFANEMPYAYQTVDGELTGEAVEIARVILERLGIPEMRGELTEFSSLINGLNAGRFDMITAGMFINPKRCESVLFADPEYRIGEALAVLAGNPHTLNSYGDIASNPDVKVAVMSGAVEIGYLEASGVRDGQIVIVPDQPAAISALQADRVQAITMTGPALSAMLASAEDERLERVMSFEQPVIDGESVFGYGATAFRSTDQAFRDAFTKELNNMKASGELMEILQQFGFTEQELPGDVTASELCDA